jgi:hypothetical protein
VHHYGFVGDTTNWVNNFVSSLTNHEPQMLMIAEQLHESAQHWEWLLYSSGGTLEIDLLTVTHLLDF